MNIKKIVTGGLLVISLLLLISTALKSNLDSSSEVAATSASARAPSYVPLNIVTSGNGLVVGDNPVIKMQYSSSLPIKCGIGGTVCVAPLVPLGSQVKLTANNVSNWSGDIGGSTCTGRTSPCTITMTKSKTITAIFSTNQYILNVTTTGNGTVIDNGYSIYNPRSSDLIRCGVAKDDDLCSTLIRPGMTIFIKNKDTSNKPPIRWSGCDNDQILNRTNVGFCSVKMTGNKTIQASFGPIRLPMK